MEDWIRQLVSPLDERLGAEILSVDPNQAVARYPVSGNTQPFGHWHGGASGVVAETLASLAALAEVGPTGAVFGVELNATHLRPVTTGWITGKATALKIGNTLATYSVRLTDDKNQLICQARVTMRLIRKS